METKTHNIAIIEGLAGDAGKGKNSHQFATMYNCDWICRFGGGNNCGHQVYRDGKKYTHHLLPCADYRIPTIKSFLSRNMYIHMPSLLEELQLFQQDYPNIASTIYIDKDAFIITEEHIQKDIEKNRHIGSTKKGISEAAISKYGRTGTRIYDLLRDNNEITSKLLSLGVHFTSVLEMREEFERSSILFEGSQGVILDVNCGIFPYISSSDATISGIFSSGFHFIKPLHRVFGVTKAGYYTKVGDMEAKNMPTEMPEQEAHILREKGGEYGSTTGRPRRIGYMDLPMTKYGIQQGGITHIILSKLDILDGQKTIKVCNSYGAGKNLYSPSDFLSGVNPQYIDLPGWENSKNIDQIMPFVKYVENYLKIPVEYVSTGVKDEDLIKL